MCIIKEMDQFFSDFEIEENRISMADHYMLGTSEKELEYVRQVFAERPRCVWTVVSGEVTSIESGMALVNRMGFYITTTPAPGDGFISYEEVEDLCEDDDEEDL